MRKIILLIVLIAAAVGALFYLKIDQEGLDSNPTPTPSQSNSPNSELLKQLGPIPAANASDAERGDFATKLRSLAQSVNFVSIGKDCALAPSMISVKSGYNLTFTNTDTVDHNISIAEQIKVPAGKEVTIKATFQGPGVYGINCDGPNIVGFIDLRE